MSVKNTQGTPPLFIPPSTTFGYISYIVDTFLFGLDAQAPDKSASARSRLLAAMAATAGRHSNLHVRDLAKCVMARVHEKQGKYAEAVALLQEVHDAEREPVKPLEAYTLERIACLVRATDSKRAVGCLEQYRRKFGKNVGSAPNLMMLAECYLKDGKAHEALQVYSELDDMCKRRQIIAIDKYRTKVQLGLVDSLTALGRHEEAQELVRSIPPALRAGR